MTNASDMEGFRYAENFTGQGELHDFPFRGTVPSAVPEPSSWAMMAAGFAGLGFLGLRRRKRRRRKFAIPVDNLARVGRGRPERADRVYGPRNPVASR